MESGIGILIVICIYMLPTLIAMSGKSKSQTPIFVVNLLFGWIILGWFACLLWACFTYGSGQSKECTTA